MKLFLLASLFLAPSAFADKDLREYKRVKASMAWMLNTTPDKIFPQTELNAKGSRTNVVFLQQAYEKFGYPAFDKNKVFDLIQTHCDGDPQIVNATASCMTDAILESREKK